MTNTTHALIDALNANTLPVMVEKGLPARNLHKGARVTQLQVTPIEGTGFKITFSAGCMNRCYFAASSARLKNGQLQMNTGDPTQRVVLRINGWVDPS